MGTVQLASGCECSGWDCAEETPLQATAQCLSREDLDGGDPSDGGNDAVAHELDVPASVVIQGGDRIDIEADHLAFRCGQEACAYTLREGSIIKCVFQPCDLDPDHIPRCSCPQQLRVAIDAERGNYTVQVFHGSDEHAGPSHPELIAEETVSIE